MMRYNVIRVATRNEGQKRQMSSVSSTREELGREAFSN